LRRPEGDGAGWLGRTIAGRINGIRDHAPAAKRLSNNPPVVLRATNRPGDARCAMGTKSIPIFAMVARVRRRKWGGETNGIQGKVGGRDKSRGERRGRDFKVGQVSRRGAADCVRVPKSGRRPGKRRPGWGRMLTPGPPFGGGYEWAGAER